MASKRFNILFFLHLFLFAGSQIIFTGTARSQAPQTSVELNGDEVEYSVDGNTISARGNVVIYYKGAALYSDEVEFDQNTQIARANGNVRLVTDQGEVRGRDMIFDFTTMTGELGGARIFASPYWGETTSMAKVGENKFEMDDMYLTTSDWDKPEYRLQAKKVEVYPGDKLIAKHVTLRLGNIPIMYFPRYTQSLNDTKPKFIFTPGYDKDWGAFVLTQYRYYFNDDFKGVLHLDYRERKDIAEGLDFNYRTDKFGQGLIRLYYMNERSITSSRIWDERTSPTIERERFKAQWRHKWDIDERTDAIWQYYKLSDSEFLKDYFESEHRDEASPESYFLLTRQLDAGVLSIRNDVRVNRFTSQVERVPEIQYNLASQKIAETPFYYKNITTFSNLTREYASPTDQRLKTMRFDIDQEISYPTRLGFIEFTPFVGTRQTYYSRTKDPSDHSVLRGLFKTGTSLSTKFFRVYDAHVDTAGLKIDKLRHIITPRVTYSYQTDPSVVAAELDQFDTVDAIDNAHKVTLSLENKLQTKRDGKVVELARAVVSSDFYLKDDPNPGGFGVVTADLDLRPTDWLTLYFDSTYDSREEHLNTANFDAYINGRSWSFGLGKRYNREVDDQFTAQFNWAINRKWALKIYERFDAEHGEWKEQGYTLTRDLHSWLLDVNFNHKQTEGSELMFIFRLKAFPDMGAIEMGSTISRSRRGSN